MPYLTLTLNGYPVDLPADAQVALSYRANDLRNLDSREAAFSETFTLPLTAQNVAVLGAPHSLDSLTTTPYQLLPAALTSPGGVEILVGFAVLEQSGEGYDVTLTDALGGLFAQVGDASLRDLDLRAFDHVLSFAAVQGSQSHDYQQGYAYALADTGRVGARAPAVGFGYYETTLATFYHAVLTAIVAAALPGYRLTGSLLSEDLYQQAVLPQPTGYLQLVEAERAALSATGRTDAPHLYPVNLGSTDAQVVPLQFPAGATSPFFAGITYTSPAFQADLSVKVHVRAALVPRHQHFDVTIVQVLLRDIGQGQGLSPDGQLVVHDLFVGFYNTVPTTTLVADLSLTLPALPPGTQLQVQLLYGGADVTLLAGSTVEWTLGPRAYPGGPVALAANLPDLKQADFLKLVCNEFNLIIQADPIFKTVRFDFFNDIERNRNQAVDWTDKLDFARRPRLAYKLGDYAQQNSLHYDDAPGAYAELYAPVTEAVGGALLPVINATLPTQAEAYAAPVVLPLVRRAQGTSLVWLPFFEADDEANPTEFYDATKQYDASQKAFVLYGGAQWKVALTSYGVIKAGQAPSTKPVIVLVAGVPVPVVAWALVDDKVAEREVKTAARLLVSDTAIVVRDDAPSAQVFTATRVLSRQGLSFSELLPAYYAGLANSLKRVQLLSVDVRLSALDIAGLDFTRPVKFLVPHRPGYGRLSCLAYLNEIAQYQPGFPGAVECTLLVLGDPVPGLAPVVGLPTAQVYQALLNEIGDAYLLAEDGSYLLLENQ